MVYVAFSRVQVGPASLLGAQTAHLVLDLTDNLLLLQNLLLTLLHCPHLLVTFLHLFQQSRMLQSIDTTKTKTKTILKKIIPANAGVTTSTTVQ